MLRPIAWRAVKRAYAHGVHSARLILRHLIRTAPPENRGARRRKESAPSRPARFSRGNVAAHDAPSPGASTNHYSIGQLTTLVALRLLLGWHLLYAGLFKIWNSGAEGLYLFDHDTLLLRLSSLLGIGGSGLNALNAMNAWALALCGAALILGLYGRRAAMLAALLLGGYCLAHLPLAWRSVQDVATPELFEALLAVALCLFPTCHLIGIDRVRRCEPGKPSASIVPSQIT